MASILSYPASLGNGVIFIPFLGEQSVTLVESGRSVSCGSAAGVNVNAAWGKQRGKRNVPNWNFGVPCEVSA